MRISRQTRRDAARVALQTLGATIAVYLIMRWLDWSHVSWAVISAIFTIQLNVDRSLVMAGGRMAGTLLGTAVGLFSVYAIGEDQILVRLGLTTALANAVATIWPALSYGAVAAAAIALNPDPEIAGAVEQAIAIALGAIIGAVATVAVWPESARRRSLRLLENALLASRDLLDEELTALSGSDLGDHAAPRDRLLEQLEQTRKELRDTRLRPRLQSGISLRDAEWRVERLWHGLVLLDRVISHKGSAVAAEDHDALTPHVQDVKRHSRSYLDALVAYLRLGRGNPDAAALKRAVADAHAAAERNLAQVDPRADPNRDRAVQALLFALDEVSDNLAELGALVTRDGAAEQ